MPVDRRDFLKNGSGALAAAGFGMGLSARPALASGPRSGEAGSDDLPLEQDEMTVDDSWLDRITGRRAQIFDAPKHLNGGILIAVANYLNAMTGPHGVPASDVVPIVALHGTAIGLVMSDPLWAKFKLGEKLDVIDPVTKEKSLRNPWLRERDPSAPMARVRIAALQERGLILVVCNNNLRGWSGMLARETEQSVDATREEIVAGLIPGAIVVPAAVAAIHRAQVAGAGYSYVGG